MSTYINIYVYSYAYIYVYMYIYIHAFIYIHIFTFIHTPAVGHASLAAGLSRKIASRQQLSAVCVTLICCEIRVGLVGFVV